MVKTPVLRSYNNYAALTLRSCTREAVRQRAATEDHARMRCDRAG